MTEAARRARLDFGCRHHPMTSSITPQIPVPGRVYLCQVGPSVSCGACCGLYNVSDPSRERLLSLLHRRTEGFSSVPRSPEAILAFGKRPAVHMRGRRPHPSFHHCPYLGLVGRGRERTGCLLHPLNPDNRGADYRGLSHHGGLACSRYFCPSTVRLPGRLKAALRAVFDDWYAYGLVVTEERLLALLLAAVERRTGALLDPGRAGATPDARAALRAVFSTKLEAPFRSDDGRPLVHHVFEDHGRCASDIRPAIGQPAEAAVRHLRPDAGAALGKALVRHLDDLLDRAAEALSRPPAGRP